MRYLTYVPLLPAGHHLRQDFAKEMQGWPRLALIATTKPRNMTLRKALSICEQAEDLKRQYDQIPLNAKGKKPLGPTMLKALDQLSFRGYNAFTELLGRDWDFIKRTNNDLAHGFMNVIWDICSVLSNKGQMKYTPKKHAEEQKAGRFPDKT